jgi:DnaK suppressor protein
MSLDVSMVRTQLSAKQIELQHDIANLIAFYPELARTRSSEDEPGDFEENARETVEMQQVQAILANQQALLAEIQDAITRIDQGMYGRCITCGQPIPERRLAVIPWAVRDVTCEEAWEQNLEEKSSV